MHLRLAYGGEFEISARVKNNVRVRSTSAHKASEQAVRQ
jgi:hypothetical protein